MKQAIAGVTPASVEEADIMTVWPSICAFPSGRFLGRLYTIAWPGVYIFRLGNLLALLSIPHALALYFYRVAPYVGIRYTLTNRRIVVRRGLMGVDDRWVDLDRFDTIEVAVRTGQQWFKAGDLVFRKDGVETFLLEGVSRPESFRHVCINAHKSYMGVKQALAVA